MYLIDYEETFAPVVKYVTIRLIIGISTANQWKLHQLDVKTAFLYGELHETIYMKIPKLPPTIDLGGGGNCLQLLKSIYGLKQASRSWNATFDKFIKSINFIVSNYDPCLYIKRTITLLLLYVDDVILTGNCEESIKNVKNELKNRFEMKDLGYCKFILGIELIEYENSITLTQKRYIMDILKRFNMEECKPVSTPLNLSIKLTKEDCPTTQNEKNDMKDIPYRQAVGSLMHLMVSSRPDISFAVNVVARYMENPGKQHWIAVKLIFRYLKGTINIGIKFNKNVSIQLQGYSDADWAGNLEDRKSTSGFIFKIADGPISWGSKKQNCVALSTSEAEYIALCLSIQEGLWINNLLCEVIYNSMQNQQRCIYEDNQSCITMSKNPTSHGRANILT